MGRKIEVRDGNIEHALAMLNREFKKEVKPILKEREGYKKPSQKRREKIVKSQRKRKSKERKEGRDWKPEPR